MDDLPGPLAQLAAAQGRCSARIEPSPEWRTVAPTDTNTPRKPVLPTGSGLLLQAPSERPRRDLAARRPPLAVTGHLSQEPKIVQCRPSGPLQSPRPGPRMWIRRATSDSGMIASRTATGDSPRSPRKEIRCLKRARTSHRRSARARLSACPDDLRGPLKEHLADLREQYLRLNWGGVK